MFSPLAGAAVEMAVAWRYGSSAVVDGFRIAYVMIAVGAGMLFVQILPHVLIPLFVERRATRSESEAWQLAVTVAAAIGVLAASAAAFVWLATGALVRVLGPGLSPEAATHARFLLRVFAIALPAMAWCATMNGVLHVYGRFFLLPFSQSLSNLAVFVCIFWGGWREGRNAFACGVLMGVAIMTGLHAAYILRILSERQLGLRDILRWTPLRAIVGALRIALPLMGVVAVQQWTALVLNRVLSTMGPGRVAQWGYSWKLMLIAAIAPTALATVLFPRLSQEANEGASAKAAATIDRTVRMGLFLIVPLLPALVLARWPLISLLFGRGAMDSDSLRAIADLFAVGLLQAPTVAVSGSLLKSAYARKDFRGPLMVCTTTALLASLAFPAAARLYGAHGLIVAAAGERWLNAAGMVMVELRANSRFRVAAMSAYFARLATLSTVIAALGYILWAPIGSWLVGASSAVMAFRLASYGAIVLMLWLFASRIVHMEEADAVKALIGSRIPAVATGRSATL